LVTILIVDDEEDVRNLAKVLLESEGYIVNTASNGEEAEKLLKKNIFDLFIIDVVMPKIDGLELYHRIRRNENLHDTPVILFSALGTGIASMLSNEERADDYIEKPFDNKILIKKVNNLLNKKH